MPQVRSGNCRSAKEPQSSGLQVCTLLMLYLFLSMAELGAQLPVLPWLPEQGAVASAFHVQPANLPQHPKNCIALGNPSEPCSEKKLSFSLVYLQI